ncbi:MAG: EthD domain-containing protein [Woeseiaceae bacterium]
MHFDRDYYVKHHIPLAQKQLAGRVRYLQMHAEFDMHVLMDGDDLRSPCVFVLYVETWKDVEAFQAFRRSSEVGPLREDIEKYTNCDLEWTVAEVTA